MLDESTRLDRVAAYNGQKLHYYYTIIDNSLSIADKELFDNIMEPTLVNAMKTNPDVKIFRDKKVTMTYTYYNNSGEHLTTIDITPDKYQ